MRFARACRRFSALCAGSNARGLAGRGSFVRRGSGSKSGRRRGTGSHSSSRRRRRHRSRSTAQIDRRNRQHRTELEPARIVSHERAGIRIEQCARHLFACRAVFRSGEFARDVPERLARLDGVLRSATDEAAAVAEAAEASLACARASPGFAPKITHAAPSAASATRGMRTEGAKTRWGRKVIEAPGTSIKKEGKSGRTKQKAPRKTRRFS